MQKTRTQPAAFRTLAIAEQIAQVQSLRYSLDRFSPALEAVLYSFDERYLLKIEQYLPGHPFNQ